MRSRKKGLQIFCSPFFFANVVAKKIALDVKYYVKNSIFVERIRILSYGRK